MPNLLQRMVKIMGKRVGAALEREFEGQTLQASRVEESILMMHSAAMDFTARLEVGTGWKNQTL